MFALCAIAVLPPALAVGASVSFVGASTPAQIAQPLKVEVAGSGRGAKGSLALPLLAERAGRLSVSYTDLVSGEPVPIDSDAPAAPGRPAIKGSLPSDPLAAGEVYVLRLRFVLPPGDGADALSGVLRLAVGGGAPLTRRVSGVAKPPAPRWAPTQSKVEITATRLLGFLSSTPDATRTIGLVDASPRKSTGSGRLVDSYVTFSDSGNATVAIDAPPRSGAAVKHADLTLSGGSGVGTATTTLDLGGGAEPAQQIEITAEVGDSLLIPLLVVLFGAFAGKLLPTWRDTRRQARLLRRDLKAAVDRYGGALAEGESPENLESIEAEVGPREVWPGRLRLLGRPRWWGHDELADKTNRTAAAVYYRLGRVSHAGTLEEETENAAELIATINGWLALRDSLLALEEAVREAKSIAGADEVEEPWMRHPLPDSRDLLGRNFVAGPDLESVAGQAELIQRQASALAVLIDISLLGLAMIELRGQEWRVPRPESRALCVYNQFPPALRRRPSDARLLVERFQEILVAARREADRLTRVELQSVVEGFFALDMVETDAVRSRRDLPPHWAVKRVVDFVAPTKAPTAEQVMAGVRRGDWFVFTAVLFVSALAYLLPVYTDGPFGTLPQYLAAFAAGAGSQVAISNTLVPLTRSYRVESTKATAGDAAATA